MISCMQCGGKFDPKNSRARFCSAKCRAAAWRRVRILAAVDGLKALRVHLAEANSDLTEIQGRLSEARVTLDGILGES